MSASGTTTINGSTRGLRVAARNGSAPGERRPSVLLLEPNLRRHAVIHALLEPRCRVDGLVGISELGRLNERRYDLAIVNVRALGLVTAAALLRQLKSPRPQMRMILAASVADATRLISTTGVPDIVLPDPPPVGDLLKCVATSLAGPRTPWWSPPVIRVAEELCASAAHTLSVGEVTRRVSTSRSLLSQQFRKEVGLAVHEFLLEVAIGLARLLLRHSDAKLAEIAPSAGFYDASHLSRVFYRYTGRRPGAFRRDGGGGAPGAARDASAG